MPWQGGPVLQATSVHWAQGCPCPVLWVPSQIGECHCLHAHGVSPELSSSWSSFYTDHLTSSISPPQRSKRPHRAGLPPGL